MAPCGPRVLAARLIALPGRAPLPDTPHVDLRHADRLTMADLQALLDADAGENVRLKFKRELPGPEEPLKKLSSFANTDGGDLSWVPRPRAPPESSSRQAVSTRSSTTSRPSSSTAHKL